MPLRQSHRGQHLAHPRAPLVRRQLGVDHQRLLQRSANLPVRIERGPRILIAVLQGPTQRRPSLGDKVADVVALEPDLPAARAMDADDRLAQRGLATTRLTHHAKDFATRH